MAWQPQVSGLPRGFFGANVRLCRSGGAAPLLCEQQACHAPERRALCAAIRQACAGPAPAQAVHPSVLRVGLPPDKIRVNPWIVSAGPSSLVVLHAGYDHSWSTRHAAGVWTTGRTSRAYGLPPPVGLVRADLHRHPFRAEPGRGARRAPAHSVTHPRHRERMGPVPTGLSGKDARRMLVCSMNPEGSGRCHCRACMLVTARPA